ncbi:hypothetical protein SGGMMB4_05447 [Sodalis glossinidius str. 'morsitans']|uniref:YjiS-like domain-containing protein n=2 Tax=Sodalis glossinidius TaxID=63612 RepID=A0A193QNH0_SODGM|nr:hypothetical protein SGGMMB4_05447 [Sodalis glossinidius str. 'morsitans']
MKTPPKYCTASLMAQSDHAVCPAALGRSGFVRRIWARLRRWLLYRRDKRILLGLSDDQLRDIGLTRDDIHRDNETLHSRWSTRRR